MATIFVGITDWNWYQYHKRHARTEVNFWKPNPGSFRSLKPGELFLFKLKKNFGDCVVGGGTFSESIRELSINEAWNRYGEANGADSIEEFRKRIEECRHVEFPTTDELFIGCRLLTDVFYLEEGDEFLIPDWPPHTVQGKKFDTASDAGHFLSEMIRKRLK